ncbi:hypothetical protein Peur_002558 [Populus x canadensis]
MKLSHTWRVLFAYLLVNNGSGVSMIKVDGSLNESEGQMLSLRRILSAKQSSASRLFHSWGSTILSQVLLMVFFFLA